MRKAYNTGVLHIPCMRCELCGRDILGKAYLGIVDRATLILCSRCVKKASKVYGPIGGRRKAAAPKPRYRSRRPVRVEEDVVIDYAERIRKARERMGFTRDVLAAMLGVKVSVVRRMEEGTLRPTLDLARKLERVLKIRLLEAVEERPREGGGLEEWEQTLGDIAVFKEG
ncbi:MAG TPA: TIGR00270 family protein [Thermofilaceae archaeon]|nr:MAG: TIGR00270 family protein [Thermoprotei archaeon]HDD34340.1 TIGR00270 family protein [Thermofilaceae archaeon]